jgi:CubicO group peptidase (beta-lactamase class C family)
MPGKGIMKWSFLIVLLALLIYGIRYVWISFPIISGYGSKNLCSCMFVAGRDEKNVKQQELNGFPFTLGTYKVNYKDSSVIATVFGFAYHKAIFRQGLGCTLINDFTEREIRQQQFNVTKVPAPNVDSVPWPSGNLISHDSLGVGINEQRLQQVLQKAFEEVDPKKVLSTRAVVVLYDGKLIAEKYAPGYDLHSKILGWSMAKSVISALIGILVKEGKLKAEMPAPVPEWQHQNDPRHAITLEHLLQQTSGLRFEEDYTKASEATNMFFRRGDMAAFAAARPLEHTPGTVFNYSSGNTNLLSRIIRQTVGEATYHSFAAFALFHKIGMYSAVMEPDASGTFVGSSFMYATARDWARFGLLYYHNGVWKGEQILPVGWVKKTSSPSAADLQKHYGYQFWLNGFDKKNMSKRLYPDVPADLYFADGFGGQEVYIIPSKKLVAVRLGLHGFNENSFLKNIIACMPGN